MLQRSLLVAIAVAGLAGQSEAALISGTGGAPNLGIVVDFDGAPSGDHPSITIGGVTFAGVGAPITIGPDFNGSFNTRGVQSLLTGFDLDPDEIEITFASPVSAFAFNWGAADNTWIMTAFDSAAAVIESHGIAAVFASNAGDYYGISAAGIKRVVLTDTGDRVGVGDYVFIDDFSYAGRHVVPEPSSLAVLGLGLASFLGLRRRARR